MLRCPAVALFIMPPPVGVAFVRPSVCPSQTLRMTREPEGLACANSEWRFPTTDATSTPVSRSKGQRSKSPGPLMLTHMVRHIFRTARPIRTSNLLRVEDDDSHQPQAPRPPRSKVKVARSRDQSEPSFPNTIAVSWEAGEGIQYRVGRTRRSHSLYYLYFSQQCAQLGAQNYINNGHWILGWCQAAEVGNMTEGERLF